MRAAPPIAMFCRLPIALLAVLLAGCAATERLPALPSACDDGYGWLDEATGPAELSFRAALLALDVYDRPDGLGLPPGLRRDSLVENPQTGFAAAVYSYGSEPVAVAFRGTSPLSARDWVFGNALALQNGEGQALLDAVRETVEPERHVFVTGHSLGGAIALSASYRTPKTPAFAFDASFRYTKGPEVDNVRVLVSSDGEVLAPLRGLRSAADRERRIQACGGGNAFSKHDMRKLALCLTQVAAIHHADARAVLERNGIGRAYGACPDRR